MSERGQLNASRVLTRELSDGPDTNLSGQMYNEYVKVEDFQKYLKDNDKVFRARTRCCFLFGILVLVGIIMAGVSFARLEELKIKLDNLQSKLGTLF